MMKELTEAKDTHYEYVGYKPVETNESGTKCPNIFIDPRSPKTKGVETEFKTGIWTNGDRGCITWVDGGNPTMILPALLSEVADHLKGLVADADGEDGKEIELHVLTSRARRGWNWETNDWE